MDWLNPWAMNWNFIGDTTPGLWRSTIPDRVYSVGPEAVLEPGAEACFLGLRLRRFGTSAGASAVLSTESDGREVDPGGLPRLRPVSFSRSKLAIAVSRLARS